MLGSRVRGSLWNGQHTFSVWNGQHTFNGIALYRLLWGGDDNTSEIGIGNVISMDLTAQTAPAASEIFNETASTGDAWIRQRK